MDHQLRIAACAALALLGASASLQAAGACSLETLRGTMAWHATYTKGGIPRAGSGFESYDGAGHVKYTELVSDGVTTSSYTGSGTYTITAGCIASVTYDGGGTPFQYFVAPDGSAYYWTNNQNSGAVVSGRADRVTSSMLVK